MMSTVCMLKTWRNGAEGYITFEMGEFGVETKQINESKTNHKKKKAMKRKEFRETKLRDQNLRKESLICTF